MNALEIELIETVETLSKISDLTRKGEIEFQGNRMLIANTVEEVKSLFNKLLHCIKGIFFEKGKQELQFRGIASIMAIAFDVARNVDQLQQQEGLTEERVLRSKSYQLLEEFYHKKIAKKIDNIAISHWILELARPDFVEGKKISVKERFPEKKFTEKRVYVDFEMLKKDIDYELAFLRTEEGTRPYAPELFHNVLLINRLFVNAENEEEKRIVGQIIEAQDRFLQKWSETLQSMVEEARQVYVAACFEKELTHLQKTLLSAFYALMLAHRAEITNIALSKTHRDYFQDYIDFVARVAGDEEMARAMAYEQSLPGLEKITLKTAVVLIQNGFSVPAPYAEAYPLLMHLIERGHMERSGENEKSGLRGRGLLWKELASDYVGLTKGCKPIVDRPLLKTRNHMENKKISGFAPLYEDNPPCLLYKLFWKEGECDLLYLPSPTSQEVIEKAKVIDEVKLFFGRQDEPVLLINLQDRTSYKEFARIEALEKFSNGSHGHLLTMNLATSTDFYRQSGLYEEISDISSFMEVVCDQLGDEASGFFFPEEIKKPLMEFIKPLFTTIHNLLFQGRHLLNKAERQEFLTWLYLLLSCKAIQLTQSKKAAFITKDGVDFSPGFSTLLYFVAMDVKAAEIGEAKRGWMKSMLFLPALLVRNRAPHQEAFQRACYAIKRWEMAKGVLGERAFQTVAKDYLELLFGEGFFSVENFSPM